MILVRAPLRISFIGGGTDLPDFCNIHPGRVISTTINQHVYLAIKHTQFINKIIVKYSTTESVDKPQNLVHNRVRESLIYMGIKNNIEIGSFASIPSRTGLGSSSSFTVALLKGLYKLQGEDIGKNTLAEVACEIEIGQLKEPIGKQDQYATAFGGLNTFEFNTNGKVNVRPVHLSPKKKEAFEDSLLLFFTGLTRDASSVLSRQTKDISKHMKTYQRIASLVDPFSDAIKKGDIKRAGRLVHESWLLKKSLSGKISNSVIDKLYDLGLKSGAWGGKVLGAGGGGCILFIAPKNKHELIRKSMFKHAKKNSLKDFDEISVEFEDKGVEVVFDHDEV